MSGSVPPPRFRAPTDILGAGQPTSVKILVAGGFGVGKTKTALVTLVEHAMSLQRTSGS